MSDEDRTVLSRYWPGPVRPRKGPSLVEWLYDLAAGSSLRSAQSKLVAEAADAIERMEKRIAALEAELADVKRERNILAEQVMP